LDARPYLQMPILDNADLPFAVMKHQVSAIVKHQVRDLHHVQVADQHPANGSL